MRAPGRQRALPLLAFCLLSLVAVLSGRALVHRIDVGRHVASPIPPGADYYPVLLAAVKLAVALLLARLAWRLARARAAEVAAGRVLAALGAVPAREAPRLRLTLSLRLWASFFAATSLIYLLQADAEQAAAGRVALLDPWLHTSALPVLAVLAVLLALLWGAVERWLAAYERLAEEAVEQARRRLARAHPEPCPARPGAPVRPPRGLFGIAVDSRPPPLPAG